MTEEAEECFQLPLQEMSDKKPWDWMDVGPDKRREVQQGKQ